MSGRGIETLQMPPLAFRIDRKRTCRENGFETLEESQEEDRFRTRRLRRTAKKYGWPAALTLAAKLEFAGEGLGVSESLASSVYMREQRIKIVGAVWQLVEECGQ